MIKHDQRRRAIALILSIAMIVTLTPSIAFMNVSEVYAEGNVAKIGNTEYTDLHEALEAVTNGQTVELLQDVTLSGNWTPVGTSTTPFKGTLDGGNYTISGLKVDSTGSLGLIGVAESSTFKNLTIKDAEIKGSGNRSAVLVGTGSSCSIDNVTIKDSTVDVEGSYVAGLVGGTYTDVSNSTVTGCTIEGTEQVGGIIGYVAGSCIKGCTVTGTSVTATSERAGGIAGKAQFADSASKTLINNNVVSGSVTAPDMAGGLAGQIMVSTSGYPSLYEIKGNTISATLSATKTNPIGILRSGQSTAFTSVLAQNSRGNWWEDSTCSDDSITYTAAETGAGDQVIYREVASIGSTGYKTLSDAIAAVKDGETIVLLNSINATGWIEINKPEVAFTIDLNGKKIERTDGSIFDIYSKVTFKDSVGTGEIKAKGRALYGNEGSDFTLESGTVTGTEGSVVNVIGTYGSAKKAAKFTMNGGTINAVGTDSNVVAVYASADTYGTQFTMNGGTINSKLTGVSAWANNSKDSAVIAINDGTINAKNQYGITSSGSKSGTKLTIVKGSVTCEGGAALYLPFNGSTSISGGTFTGREAVVVKGGNVDISGGTFTANGTANDPSSPTSSGASSTGDAIYVEDNYDDADGINLDVTLNITGGTFISKNAHALSARFSNDENGAVVNITGASAKFKAAEGKDAIYTSNGFDGTIAISAGYYSSKPDSKYVAKGKAAIDTPEGTERTEGYLYVIDNEVVAQIGSTKYSTLADAIAAVKDGETITMLADVSAAGGISVPSGKNFTVDFDGHTYKAEKPGAGSAGTTTQAFQLLKNSDITFKNGTIACTDANASYTWDTSDKTAEKGVAMIIQNYADLTLDNMVIDGTNIAHNGNNVRYVMSNNCGTVTIKDTTITAVSGDFAFDSCKYSTYAKPTVNVTGTSVINGKVELTGGDVNLESGSTVNGMVRVGENKDGTSVKDSVLNIKSGATVANSQHAIAVFGKNEVNIAGKVTGTILTQGNAYNAGSVINVNEGASITADEYDIAIYMPNGELNVTGGTISGDTAVYFKSTKLNISGGTLIADGPKKDYKYDGSGANATGDALLIDSCNYPNGIEDVSITGGCFKSTNNHAVAAFTSQGGIPIKNFIAGGHFSDKPDADYIALGKSAVADEEEYVTEGYNWTIGTEKYTVTASSALTNNHSATVAAITGGGLYADGTSVTLKAPEVAGLTFKGWCKGEVSTEYASTDATYSFNVSADVEYIAVYEASSEDPVVISGEVTGGAQDAGTVTVKGTQKTSESTQVGNTVVFEATVDKTVKEEGTGREPRFVCWQNKEGAVLGTETTYECTAVQAETVEALYLYEGAAIVQFNNDAGEFLQSKVVVESNASNVTTVVLESKRGQDFDCWVDSLTGTTMTDDQVKSAIQTASATTTGAGFGVVNVTAKFKAAQQYKVTIHMYNVDQSRELGTETTITKNVGEAIKYTADLQNVTKDMSFIGYSTDTTEAKIFCTSNILTLNPDKAEEFEYWILYKNDTTQPEVPATVTLGEPYDASTNVHKMGFTMSWALPEGATFIEAGFFDAASKDALDAMAAGDVDKTSLTGSTGSFTLIFNREGKEEAKLYLRAYVKYSLGGNTYYVINGVGGTVNSTPIKKSSLTTADVSGLDYVSKCFNDLSK